MVSEKSRCWRPEKGNETKISSKGAPYQGFASFWRIEDETFDRGKKIRLT
ncbi:hypothetical protein EHW99_1833 [Erwinia amylovora]|uniref:Uncharacterized protein n=2 Tax=Erwinia amylovora TaxID=552 RepID=A0A830ZZT8_ERWAM|nr:hypothetical protein EaACW_1757 [Erwinia amylovora ACW56400]QJQ54537.1 hypothetical protein EHX00_1833 [Erwinia amylovora]CBA20701.1 hypothetical protein predicted by Glimmer/Critica [Erwinia amylovora CFBP1430]CBJ46394.1 hypothetical protein EAM_1719 [Erwinia amylovora ATCC 49946]CCO78605.1 hypothetical protein BN432_1807 [Erwinia amylovora Ea356]CCO82399.1 hypothetical protein BN433_1829 [Erwinia amylovora Ea266]CCO86185.1 hypothetical protein BN434_1797 [Erwinia amylovora CFBP 2585]CCO